jgi:thiamine biosynthesis lipoprotein
MGCNFEITVVANSTQEANLFIDSAESEIVRIESLISSWRKDSQTSSINNNAGIKPVKVDSELFDLIERSIKISRLTDGAFDLSYASMDKIWRFDGSMKNKPSTEDITNSVKLIGFENIILNKSESTVFLKNKGMKIGFGGIGKGYAADEAKKLLLKKGVKAGIINASGDMSTWGKQPSGKPWEVAITNPLNKNKAFGLLPIINGAVVTSGNYEKFVLFDGIRYSHIIDPRTGYPSTGILSVTVFAPMAELADALATSVFVMGIEVGMNRIEQIPGVECIIVDEKGELHQTKNIKIKLN